MPTPTLEIYNGRYYAIWSENRRSRRKSMGTADHAVAERRFAQWILLGGHKGEVAEEGKAALTMADLWAVYDEQHISNPRKVASPGTLRNSWRNLEQHFGKLTVTDIDQTTINSYEAKRTSGRIGRPAKSSTVRREIAALMACINWNADARRGKHRLVEKRDLPNIELPEEGQPRDRWLRSDEMQRLLDAAARQRRGGRLSRGERFLWIALETAARKSAILNLTWDRVDFDAGVIHFADPGVRTTKKRRASVPISKALRPILERAKAEAENELVMTNTADVWATVQWIAIEAGFGGVRPKTSQKPKASGISPHTLRHTAATHMARNGVSLWNIAKILGNTLAMVEKVYAKWSPDNADGTVNKISNGVLEPAE